MSSLKPGLEEALAVFLRSDDVESVERALGGLDNVIDADSGVSVLGMAASAGATRVVQALIHRGVPPQVGGVVSPLQEAVKGRFAAVVEVLLSASADPDESDEDDEETPLSLACYFEAWEIVGLLVDAGAVRCDPEGLAKLLAKGPLLLADRVVERVVAAAPHRAVDYFSVLAGHEREAGGSLPPERARKLKSTRVLLEGLLPRYQRWASLEDLAVAGRKDELRRALERLDDEERLQARTAALIAAIGNARWDVYQEFFGDGVDVRAVASNGRTLLMIAAMEGRPQLCTTLLRMGARLDQRELEYPYESAREILEKCQLGAVIAAFEAESR